MSKENRHLLYIDDKPVNYYPNLKAAQLAAKPSTENGIAARIETMVAPAPSQIWIFDKNEKDWVEQI